jgi:predicted AAA+ superfamily ATPase
MFDDISVHPSHPPVIQGTDSKWWGYIPNFCLFSEIYKSYTNAGLEPPIFYYRDRDQKEIDLLLYQDGTLYPIEIKKSASPGTEAVKHFSALHPVTQPERFGALEQFKTEIGTGAVVCMANDLLPVDRYNWLVPVWLI